MKALYWTDSDEKRFDIFNIGNSRTISLSDLVSTIERVVGKNAVINGFPQSPGDVNQTFANITHAQTVLGYAPLTMLEEGIVKENECLKEALS